MEKTNLKIMGIIGIRSGSKGVPNKNIKLLAGKPLVGWILDKAKKSKYINRLIVSTDSQEYADIATSIGAEVPCLRPDNLATDNAPEFEYVKHMLECLQNKERYKPDIVVRMMATSPMQTSEDIDKVIEILIKNESADSAVIISEMRQHPYKALKIIKDDKLGKRLVSYFGESGREVTPIDRQSYVKAYVRSNIIACRIETIINTDSLTGDNVKYHIIPQERSIDIDNEIDFSIAEILIK
jgi:CMP-N,N'-diacetyllegionaminic acid synthase